MNVTIGESIKIIRRRAKMSQAQLAKRAGMSRANISLIERNSNPTIGSLIAIGEALGFAIDIKLVDKPAARSRAGKRGGRR